MPLNRARKNLVIFAGQSILNGRGDAHRYNTNIKYWDTDDGSFSVVKPGVNTFTSPTFSGVSAATWGPEVAFAGQCAKLGINYTHIFKFCSDASTSVLFPGIDNSWHPDSPNDLMSKFLTEVQKVIAEMGGYTQINNITLVWGQGETEAFSPILTPNYEQSTKEVLNRFIDEFQPNVDFNILRFKINENSIMTETSVIEGIQELMDPLRWGTLLDVDHVALGPDGVHYAGYDHDRLGDAIFIQWGLEK